MSDAPFLVRVGLAILLTLHDYARPMPAPVLHIALHCAGYKVYKYHFEMLLEGAIKEGWIKREGEWVTLTLEGHKWAQKAVQKVAN